MEEHSLARAKATGGVGSDSADGATSSPEGRIALFDNLKGLLIILVVLGHIAHPVHNTNPVLSFAFDVVYLFHMPLFVLMSGLFAKSAYRNGKLKINRIISFIALGFAYQLALALINGAKLTPLRICAFTSAPWYLISMGCWYAMTPVLARLGTVRGMVASIASPCFRAWWTPRAASCHRAHVRFPAVLCPRLLPAPRNRREPAWTQHTMARPLPRGNRGGNAPHRHGFIQLVLPDGLWRQPICKRAF